VFNLAGVLAYFLLGAGAIGLVVFRCGQAALHALQEEKKVGGRFWLAGGVGLLLVAIVLGVGTVIGTLQIREFRARVVLARAEEAFSNGDFDKAVAGFNEAIQIYPWLAVAFNDRGAVWLERGENDKALADLNEAVRLKPKLASALVNRSIVWTKKGEFDKALTDSSEAIRVDPKLANAFNNRALAWVGKCEFDQALADSTEALRLEPRMAKGFNNRGFAWDGKGDYGKAIADWTEAIRLDPQLAMAYNNLAWLCATCPDPRYRDSKEALRNATKACELSTWRDQNRLSTLAAAHAEAGDFADAMKWQQKAIEIAPKEVVDELRLCLALYKAHKPMRRPDVYDLAACVRTLADIQTRPNLDTLLASFKASRVGVRVPPEVGPVNPGPQKLNGDMKLIPTSTLPDGRRFLVVLADIKGLAAHEPQSRFAELAANDVIQLALKKGTGIVVQTLPPGRPTWAAISKEAVVRLARWPPET
jgi:tetratricopeptide (TPR) repeat protein